MRKDGRQLLIETFPLNIPSKDIIQQSIRQNNGTLFLTGRLQHADLENGNGRIYPLEILDKQVKKYQQKIKNGTSLGQRDHPDSDQISLQNVAILIKQLHWNGKQLLGTIMLLSNDVGRNMKALVQDGVSLSISSRGIGSLKRTDRGDEVQDDFELVGWDLVVQPSTPGATFYNNKVKQNIESKLQKVIKDKQKQKVNKPDQNKKSKKLLTKQQKLNYLIDEINEILK